MDTLPKIKQVTFAVLDEIPDGVEFHGSDITSSVRARTLVFRRFPMDGTVTRYMRHYSRQRRPIRRVGAKEQSTYRVGASA